MFGFALAGALLRGAVSPLHRLARLARAAMTDGSRSGVSFGAPYPAGVAWELTREFDEFFRQAARRRELEREAATDPLTELANRRAFFVALELAIERAGVSDEDFLLCYLDVNGFKGINDSLGHMTGDQALMDIAHILRTSFRTTDVIARLGGDEFAAIAFGVSQEGASELRDRLEGTLEQFNAFANGPYTLSLSIGIMGYAPMLTADALLQLADEAMYREKHGTPPTEEAA